ncbi:hypothetical protein M0805_001424 [Coniferiporia weirii]|nr:hypothetical protein M0805_001424 [Coniferiporia weirii]
MHLVEHAPLSSKKAKQGTADMMRARKTAQHAHMYLTRVLGICDAVIGGDTDLSGRGRVRLFAGGFGTMGRVSDYQEAVMLAGRAQVCLTECVRMVKEHGDIVPGAVKEDLEGLEKDGVMQIAKVYNVVFGGRMIDSGVGGTIKRLLGQQETAYGRLTRVAVWTQEQVPESERVEREAAAGRDGARGRAAGLWREAAAVANWE